MNAWWNPSGRFLFSSEWVNLQPLPVSHFRLPFDSRHFTYLTRLIKSKLRVGTRWTAVVPSPVGLQLSSVWLSNYIMLLWAPINTFHLEYTPSGGAPLSFRLRCGGPDSFNPLLFHGPCVNFLFRLFGAEVCLINLSVWGLSAHIYRLCSPRLTDYRTYLMTSRKSFRLPHYNRFSRVKGR